MTGLWYWLVSPELRSSLERRTRDPHLDRSGASSLMTIDLTERQTGDAVEFLDGGVLVGTLTWVGVVSEAHDAAGWYLEVPGTPPTLLFQAPTGQADDLVQARRDSKSASLFFAKTMVTDRLAGLLAREMGAIPLQP